MMEHPLNIDGPLMGFLNKTGQLIALSVLWLLSCLPVVTAPAATTALYYTVCKTVRHDRGSALQEYRRSFRVNLLRGMGAGLPPALLTAVLMLNLGILSAAEGSNLLRWATLLGLLLLSAASVYLCPILSRFTMKVTDVWKLSFVMALRFWYLTLPVMAAAAVGALAQFYLLPIPTLAIFPGAMVLAATWPVEKALRHYMPKKEENDNSWCYE